MGDFNRESKFGRRSSGGRSSSRRSSGSFDRDDSGERSPRRFDRGPRRSSFEKEMHSVTCDKCGKECEVPFKPTSGKPVYCRDCFRKDDSDGPRASSNQSSEALDQINMKLDKILKILEE